MIDYETVRPGDVIVVDIEGKDYETVIDENGAQRFRVNTVLQYMFEHNSKGEPADMGRDAQGYIIPDRMLNLNQLALAFHQGKFDKRDYMELIMQGYSVSGFCDLHEFWDWHITNPLWSDEPQRIGGDQNELYEAAKEALGLD